MDARKPLRCGEPTAAFRSFWAGDNQRIPGPLKPRAASMKEATDFDRFFAGRDRCRYQNAASIEGIYRGTTICGQQDHEAVLPAIGSQLSLNHDAVHDDGIGLRRVQLVLGRIKQVIGKHDQVGDLAGFDTSKIIFLA